MSDGRQNAVSDGAQAAISLDLLLRNLPGAVYRCNGADRSRFAFVSDGVHKLTGYGASAFTGSPARRYASIVHPEDRAAADQQLAAALRDQRPFQLSYRILAAGGEARWVWEQGDALRDAAGEVIALEGFIADITRLKLADSRMLEQASLLDKAHDAIVVIDMDCRITYWNKGAERLFGWSALEAINRRADALLSPELNTDHAAYLACLTDGEWIGELTHARRDGTPLDTEMRWTLLTPEAGSTSTQKILLSSIDIGERKHNEAKMHRLAFLDALTELPNRSNLLDHLRQVLLASTRSGKIGALLFCDLDNFKQLNDTRGHAAGDELLRAVAQRLLHAVRAVDQVARLGGDEFIVLIEPGNETFEAAAHQAEAVARKILLALTPSFRLANCVHDLSASIGISLYSGAQNTVESTLQQADVAMYEAKKSGGSAFRFFDPGMHTALNERIELENALREAIARQQFVLHYQPQLDATGQVTGAEALLRWRRDGVNLTLPDSFIKTAEETGLIVDIGNWVLGTACAQLAQWQHHAETRRLTVSVNVSARQFFETNYVARARQIIRASGADPTKLKLELTESLLVADIGNTAAKMLDLKTLGLQFSLDDFGTGYSSLTYLRKLPLDQLKIDHSFMKDVLTNNNDASVVKSIIALGGSLGFQVVAEGVETLGQRDFLSAAGCFMYQGFLYQRAIPGDEVASYAQVRH
ncbi:putative bifunctional diguanylate cyclase/phosphodiesterase [Massilia sp. S19_KUP03_FR1]|uniref:putative bifunctional diguanylate cyclase/phosphodiesterase n=1 Tax=Massilia sp. S19_KUP03_FR1 TaxID=3025503 RepID=UPI002FCDD1A9